MPTLLERVEAAAERVRQAEEGLEAERRLLYEEIRQAHREGIPVTRVARAAGMSRQWVTQLVKG